MMLFSAAYVMQFIYVRCHIYCVIVVMSLCMMSLCMMSFFLQFHMGMCGEDTAEKYDISREEQDAYAIQ